MVPVDTLLSLIFFAFSIAFVVLLSATTSPPLHGMLMPSAVLDSVGGDGGFFGVSEQMTGGRIGGGFAEGLGLHATRPRPGSLLASTAHLLHPLEVCLFGLCWDLQAGHVACLVPAVIETECLGVPTCAHGGIIELGPLCEAHPHELRPQFALLQFEIRTLLFILYHIVGVLAPLLLLLFLLPLL
jgi:hypothetical protein